MLYPMLAIMSPEVLGVAFVAFLGVILIGIVPYYLILRKAGFSGWWVVLMFVPIANVIAPWVFALSRWPVLERREIGA